MSDGLSMFFIIYQHEKKSIMKVKSTYIVHYNRCGVHFPILQMIIKTLKLQLSIQLSSLVWIALYSTHKLKTSVLKTHIFQS